MVIFYMAIDMAYGQLSRLDQTCARYTDLRGGIEGILRGGIGGISKIFRRVL